MPATPKAPHPTQNTVFDLPVATITILAIILVGAIDLLVDGHLSGDYKTYVSVISVPVAGLAVGRGFAARKAG
jgi:hypothetical protein